MEPIQQLIFEGVIDNKEIEDEIRKLKKKAFSKERSTALRSSECHCEECGIKQSAAKGKEVKLEVHHLVS